MSNEVLERRFAAIGARLKLETPQVGSARIDVGADARGEFFDVSFDGKGGAPELEVVAVAPADRHLLLLVRDGGEKRKFLCGHDERHWFVAAIPESARGVTGVKAAKAALQPAVVSAAVARVRPKDGFRRRNTAYVRQGEWFFVPAPGLQPDAVHVLRNERLTRGRGKPHVMEYVYRRGGQTVWRNWSNPTGISEARYRRLSDDERRHGGWAAFTRDPEVYARGAIRHPDHATIVLADWHRVVMNTEHESQAMQHVVFLD